jgi:signal transduction histidine kinase
MQVEATRRMLQKGQRDPETHLAWAGRMAREGLNEARRAVYALMPEALEMKPLPEAVGKLVEEIRSEAGEEIELSVNGEFKPLPSVVSLNLFRIVQEALTNARHHAAAAHIHVELDYRDPGLALRVSDDGKGFDPHNTASSGYGLISMRERAERIGGELTIESQPGQGTRVLLAVAL